MHQNRHADLSQRPALTEALRTAAQQEHCSIANMMEGPIRDDCGRNGMRIKQPTLKAGAEKK